MKKKTIMSLIQVASWIVFIGLCIKAGVFLFAVVISFMFSPQAARGLYPGVDLWAILNYSRIHYMGLVLLIFLIWSLKAFLFYRVINIFGKLDVNRPFSPPIAAWIQNLSKIAVQIGVLALVAKSHVKWLSTLDLNFTYEAFGVEFLYLAGILFIIAQVFKRGIEMQSENELTI